MPAKPTGLQQLLVEDLQDLYDAEKQLVRALPKMAKSCSNEELGNAFREHLEVTKGQVQRLEQVFEQMGMKARSKPCKAMKGLVEEAQELMQEHDEEEMLDAALIGAGRKVEHYEMAGYESARLTAAQLGMKEAAQLLQETLREEMETDKMLARISKQVLKTASSAGEMEMGEGQEGGGRQGGRQSGSRGGRQQSSGGGRSGSASQRGRSGAQAKSSSGGARGGRGGRGSAEPVTDHERIREWAEERGAQPACVRGTGAKGDTGMIRLDFPGYSGEESLEHISWDDWFEKFDENNLALLMREQDNFNKLVRRPEEASSGRGKTRTAR